MGYLSWVFDERERERERATRNSVVVTRKFDEECKLEREIRWKMYCHFSWRRSISPWNLARKISLVLLLIYIHLQIFPIPITNINREIESRDSISIFHSIIPQISNFSTLGRRSKPEESGIKFFFSAPKDADNNKQRIRREAKFLFPYPLPSFVQPRRARIYASKRITMGRGGKKKKKREGGGGRRKTTELRGLSNFSFTLVNPRNALSRCSHQSRNVPGPAATPRTT